VGKNSGVLEKGRGLEKAAKKETLEKGAEKKKKDVCQKELVRRKPGKPTSRIRGGKGKKLGNWGTSKFGKKKRREGRNLLLAEGERTRTGRKRVQRPRKKIWRGGYSKRKGLGSHFEKERARGVDGRE